MQIEISASIRKLHGTGASRRMRASGKLPGVVYGGDGASQSIEMNHKDLYYSLKAEAFHASILSLSIDGNPVQVVLRDYQMHPFKQQILHIDFQRINQNQKMHVKLPLHFVNAELAPGVKLSGGIVSHILTEVEVSCLPKDLPEFVTVDLSEMKVGGILHLSDLTLPSGVEISALTKGDDQPVVTLTTPRGGSSDESGSEVEASSSQ
ncbi:MAG: 50S ribosomal protein L25/general stress protein Ctc [Nitrosomonas sp.]|nr:50S ribosomal protein L25/general stress protein Ctc [Nitrosomonas sp.]